jgi:hypothetical protein
MGVPVLEDKESSALMRSGTWHGGRREAPRAWPVSDFRPEGFAKWREDFNKRVGGKRSGMAIPEVPAGSRASGGGGGGGGKRRRVGGGGCAADPAPTGESSSDGGVALAAPEARVVQGHAVGAPGPAPAHGAAQGGALLPPQLLVNPQAVGGGVGQEALVHQQIQAHAASLVHHATQIGWLSSILYPPGAGGA